jgi:hypothetical protein
MSSRPIPHDVASGCKTPIPLICRDFRHSWPHRRLVAVPPARNSRDTAFWEITPGKYAVTESRGIPLALCNAAAVTKGQPRSLRSMRSCTCPPSASLAHDGSSESAYHLANPRGPTPAHGRELTVREPPCSPRASTAPARTTFLPRHTPSRNRRRRSVRRRVILTELFSRPSEIPAELRSSAPSPP